MIGVQVFMSPKLSVIALSIVPPIALLSRGYGRYVQNITKQVQDSLADATQVTITFCHSFQHAGFQTVRYVGVFKLPSPFLGLVRARPPNAFLVFV